MNERKKTKFNRLTGTLYSNDSQSRSTFIYYYHYYYYYY